MMFHREFEITYGGLSKDEAFMTLSESKIGLNAFAAMQFASSEMQFTKKEKAANVVIIDVKNLGFQNGAKTNDIYKSAAKIGLMLCPIDLPIYLRLAYKDQPEGEVVTIASESIWRDKTKPRGFYLKNESGVLWLRGYRCDDEWVWDANSYFSFIQKHA